MHTAILYKKFCLPFIALFCLLSANAQRIVLAPLYTPADLASHGKLITVMQPAGLKPLVHDKIITSKLPRYLKPSCITHDPFTFLQFKATRQNDATVALEFETIHEYTSRSFIIERVYAQGTEEADFTQPADTCYQLFLQANRVAAFSTADSAYAKNRHEHKYSYKLTDHNIYNGITFYRITETDAANSTVATEIIAVPGRPLKETVAVYPDPVKSTASINVVSKYAGPCTVQLVTINGKVVKQFSASLVKGANTLPFSMSSVSSGIYKVIILRSGHPAMQMSLIKQ